MKNNTMTIFTVQDGSNVKFFPLKEFENQKWSFQLVPISTNQQDFLPFFTHNFPRYLAKI